MKKIITIITCLLFVFASSKGNNIQIANVGITGQNSAQQYSFVKFDLSWENSWRISVGPSNWDAAWIFIKYRINSGVWQHARLNYVNGTGDGHIAPAGASIRTANDGLSYGLGTFIHRSADGSGDVNWQNIQLRWNYGLNGVNDNDLVDVQVFAIEMVYVPQGAFFVGGAGGTESGKFYTYPTTTNSFKISSEAAITVGTAAGNLYYDAVSASGDRLGPVPAAFPKGFNSFYCMKYEVSQDQWVSFFNTLTDAQKLNRDITDATHKMNDGEVARNSVAWSGSGNATTNTPNRPVSYINWEDSNAYLDWAALRPMSELEYEKACRGTLPAVADEFAWGTANIHSTAYTLTGDGTTNENVNNPGVGTGNASYGSTDGTVNGPLRCGIFAASAVNKNREETGGSYYGIMELSGSLYERTVTLGLPAGRNFTGSHGNGFINSAGNNTTGGWPNTGGYRGGSYANSSAYIRVSDRTDAANLTDIVNSRIGAARGVRTSN